MHPHRFLLVSASVLILSMAGASAQNNSITPTGDNADVSQTNTTTSTNTTIDSTSTNSSTINGTQINNNNTYIVPPDGNTTNGGSRYSNNGNGNGNSSIRNRGSRYNRDTSNSPSRYYDRDDQDARRAERIERATERSYERTSIERSDGLYTPSKLYKDPSVTGSARTINNRALGDGNVTPRGTGPAAPVYVVSPTGANNVYNSSNPPPTTITSPAPAPTTPTPDSGRGGYRGDHGGRHRH